MEKGAQCLLHFLLHPEISSDKYKLVSEKMKEPLTVIPIEGMTSDASALSERPVPINGVIEAQVMIFSSTQEPRTQGRISTKF